ncbi:GNAT family N-acetyltransferase [Luteimonas sp. RIT-PG2_3]
MEMADFAFETERLRVRRWRSSDLAALVSVYGDADAMRWVGDGQAITREQCMRWLDVTAANYERRGYGMFAVEQHATPGVIGFCGLVHPDDQPEPEIKYAFLRSHWGQGFATEAARGLMAYGASTFRMELIIATTAPANTASHRVLLKAGMTRGDLRCDEDGSQTQVFHWHATLP